MENEPFTQGLLVLSQLLAEGKPLRVQMERNGLRGEMIVQRIGETAPASPRQEHEEGELTPTQEAIVKVLEEADKPIKASVIAIRAKCKFNEHFRRMVYALVKKGMLKPMEGYRYWLASRDAPPGAEGQP